MNGQAIAADALSYAGLKCFTTEQGGPRPATVRAGETTGEAQDPRATQVPPRDSADRPRRDEPGAATRP